MSLPLFLILMFVRANTKTPFADQQTFQPTSGGKKPDVVSINTFSSSCNVYPDSLCNGLINPQRINR